MISQLDNVKSNKKLVHFVDNERGTVLNYTCTKKLRKFFVCSFSLFKMYKLLRIVKMNQETINFTEVIKYDLHILCNKKREVEKSYEEKESNVIISGYCYGSNLFFWIEQHRCYGFRF